MSVLTDALSALGLHPDILAAIARAELDPSSANINAVVRAYAAQAEAANRPAWRALYDAWRATA